MRVVIIGGSGHVGTYLVPRLVDAGHEVINVSRAQREPYQAHGAWRSVQRVNANREEEDAQGMFGQRVLDLEPDIVIDMICFTLASAQQIVECLRGQVQHFLHCGTIWSMGHSVEVPATEETPRQPFGEYGIQKSAIQDYLLDQARRHGFPATVLRGHTVGTGFDSINPRAT
jgi:nucleoside-diphosphate-sugar epimerase